MIQVVLKNGKYAIYNTKGGSIPPVVSSVTIPTNIVVNTPIAVSYTIVGSTTTITRTWYRGVAVIATSTTSDLYTPVQADAGNASNIKCVVTATNAAGSSSADSNTVAQVLTARTGAFLTASAISDATIRGGLNTFDIGLIANSLDTKMKALYPFVADGADNNARALQQRWNFMDARDLDAAFRLTFGGTTTHSSNGFQGNGTNGFANTFVNPSANLNSFNNHLSFYSRTNAENNNVEIGSNGTSFMHMHLRHPTNQFYALLQQNVVDGVTNTSSTGFYVGNRTANNVKKHFKNGVNLGTSTTLSTSVLNSFNIYISALNNSGSAVNYSTKQCAFASIGNGLSDSESNTLYTLVQAFQTTLGRQV